MSDAVWVALVTGGCTLAATYIANKTSADREDKRRLSEISREKAAERIEKLYKRGLFRYGGKSNDLRNCQVGNKLIESMMKIDYVKVTDC